MTPGAALHFGHATPGDAGSRWCFLTTPPLAPPAREGAQPSRERPQPILRLTMADMTRWTCGYMSRRTNPVAACPPRNWVRCPGSVACLTEPGWIRRFVCLNLVCGPRWLPWCLLGGVPAGQGFL